MKKSSFIFAILITTFTCYAEECTYDQAAQIEQLHSLAKNHPGGILDEASRTLTWRSDSNIASSLTYGGCHHLGFKVIKNIASPGKLTEAEVLTLAIALARAYWEPSEAEALSAAATRKTFSRETTNRGTYFNIPNEYYSEFYIEHNLSDSYVAIAWTRNF